MLHSIRTLLYNNIVTWYKVTIDTPYNLIIKTLNLNHSSPSALGYNKKAIFNSHLSLEQVIAISKAKEKIIIIATYTLRPHFSVAERTLASDPWPELFRK